MADSGGTFPAADAEIELNPEKNKDFQVDSVSSKLSSNAENKEREAAAKKAKEKDRKDAVQTLKTTIIVSAVVVAVAGAIFAITKKLREK